MASEAKKMNKKNIVVESKDSHFKLSVQGRFCWGLLSIGPQVEGSRH